MVFHQKYEPDNLERRSKIFGVLILITLILFISTFIFVQGQEYDETVGWQNRSTLVSEDLNSILALNETSVITVGDSGSMLISDDSGQNWTSVLLPSQANYYDIKQNGLLKVIAGSEGTIFSNYNNSGWIDISISSSDTIYSVTIPEVLSADNATIYVSTLGGEIWKSTDAGQTWDNQFDDNQISFYSIDFYNTTFGLVSGSSGTILGTLDGGENWAERDVPEKVSDLVIRDINLYSPIRAFAVGDNGTFLKSTFSQGSTVSFSWDASDTSSTSHLNKVSVDSINRMWMVGTNGTIILTRDGGATFTKQKLSEDIDETTSINGIVMVNSEIGYAVGSSGVVAWTDSGGVAISDVPTVKDYSDFGVYLDESLPLLTEGFINMLEIIFISMIIGFILGILLAIMRTTDLPLFTIPATIFTDFFRNTPLLVQIFIIHFGFPEIGIDVTIGGLIENRSFASSIISLGLNSAAYQAEIIRSGIQSIPTGQMEAGRSVGLSYGQTMRYIILPQAIRAVIPPLGNEFVNLTLNSSLVVTIGYTELTRAGRLIIAATFLNFRTWVLVAMFYFVITYTLTNILRYAEKKTRIPGLGMGRR